MEFRGSHSGQSLVHHWLQSQSEQYLARDPEETDSSPSDDEFDADSDNELHLQAEQHLATDPEETDSSPSGDEFDADIDDVIDVSEINRAAFIRDPDIHNDSFISWDDLSEHVMNILEDDVNEWNMHIVQDEYMEEDYGFEFILDDDWSSEISDLFANEE